MQSDEEAIRSQAGMVPRRGERAEEHADLD
jgi:hypothetical protein